MAAPVYLADTSAYVLAAKDQAVDRRMTRLVTDGQVAACQMAALEYLNNARDPKAYESMWYAVQGQRWMDVTAEAMDRALDVHRLLAQHSQHRNFSLPDLIIAATAELNGATVLHYDSDYDRIAAVTGQPVEWVVPKGSI